MWQWTWSLITAQDALTRCLDRTSLKLLWGSLCLFWWDAENCFDCSHIPPVTKRSTWGELISLWIAPTCDHSKPPGCSEHESWIFCSFLKYRKAVWLFDPWTSWHVYLWNPLTTLKFLSRHRSLTFQTYNGGCCIKCSEELSKLPYQK